MRSVSSVSVDSCVSDIVAELPPSFTVPLDQVLRRALIPCRPWPDTNPSQCLLCPLQSLLCPALAAPGQTMLNLLRSMCIESGCASFQTPTARCIHKPLAILLERKISIDAAPDHCAHPRHM